MLAIRKVNLTRAEGRAGRRSSFRKKWKESGPLLVMLIPGILFYLLFKYTPMFGLFITFKDYNLMDGVWGSPWVGMHNFEKLFNQPATIEIIRNTVVLGLMGLVFGFPMPILMALMLNEIRSLTYKKIVQTIVYLPHFFSWVIVGGMVITLFSLDGGSINKWLSVFNVEAYPFLYKPISWIGVFIGSGIWKEMGYGAIIYLAALTTIDPSLYESASLDGASRLKQIWYITLPGISTTVVIMLILNMGHIMDVSFDRAFILQNAAVSDISEVISTYIYKQGIQRGLFGITSAMSMFESVVGLILVVTANSIARRFGQNLW